MENKFKIGDIVIINRNISTLVKGDELLVTGIMNSSGVIDRYHCMKNLEEEDAVYYLREEWLEFLDEYIDDEDEIEVEEIEFIAGPIIEVPEWIQKALEDFETSDSYEEKEYFGREDEFSTSSVRLPLKVTDEAENFMLECMYDNALTIKQRMIDKALDERDKDLFDLVLSGHYDFNGEDFDYE